MAPERGRVAGVVLAAGASRRMGQDKLYLRLEGETLLRRAARRAAAAGLDPVLVVVGRDPDRAEAELAHLACAAVRNPEPERGMNASLRRGIGAVPEDAAAAVVALADMPLVTSAMLADLVARWRADGAPLVVSDYGGVLAPPMLYGRRLFPELGELDGDGCGKRVVKRHREEAATIARAPAALADLDEPADWERIRAGLEGGAA